MISLTIMLVLSIVDAIIEVKESNDLVEKANTLIGNTNSIIVGLDENIQSIKKTGKSIIKIDSDLNGVRDTLTNQVVILKSAVSKSKELVHLEELKFQQDEPIMVSYNKDIILAKNANDSTKSNFKYRIVNEGKRTSKIIKLNIKLYYYTIATRELINVELTQQKGLSNINKEIPYKSSVSGEFEFIWHKIPNKFDALLFMLNSNYKDVISNKNLTNNEYYIAKNLTPDTIKFSILNDYEFAIKLNDKLNKDNLKDYIIDLDKLLINK